MHLVLTGATGLVGGCVLQAMLTKESVTKISIISRRPVAMAEGHEKVQVFIQRDFSSIESSTLEQLKGAHGCVWALGISMSQVGKDEYVKITEEYALNAAKQFSTLSDTFNFVHVSGEGATDKPGRFTALFARIKGRTEAGLLELPTQYPSLKIYNVRPGGVDAKNQPAIHPFIPKYPSLLKKGEAMLFPLIRATYPSMISPTKELGDFMVDLASGDGKPLEGPGIEAGGRTISNRAIRRIAGFKSGI
ncbi:hypothetical protein EV356DRAFT_444226 [Viridothelium virens]|uniref:Nucleoside-diphosphate-sugar epimerase n=1 Tax=Viridothelium virens TaxID=1048519 RepID=A0A6A6HD11_VIRVR|nr:hypothetical protein EV356DRAFT_444226 [Viridothelium virens]